MGKAFLDESKLAYSLFNALSKVQISTLICGFSICQVCDVLTVPPLTPEAPETLMLKATSSTLIIGSMALWTISNSMVIGAHLRGSNLPQDNNPDNGLKDTVLDCPALTET